MPKHHGILTRILLGIVRIPDNLVEAQDLKNSKSLVLSLRPLAVGIRKIC